MTNFHVCVVAAVSFWIGILARSDDEDVGFLGYLAAGIGFVLTVFTIIELVIRGLNA